jgi:hypothetical protein
MDLRSVKEQWLDLKCPDSIEQFLHEVSQAFEPELRFAKPLGNLVHSICGTENEGVEISLGMLIRRRGGKASRKLAKAAICESLLSRWQKREIKPSDLVAFELASLRKVLEEMRESVLGWTPGLYDHTVLTFTAHDDKLHLTGAQVLLFRSDHPVNIDRAYQHISGDPRTAHTSSLAVWIKPCRTIRLYYRGRYMAQVMRLRDSNLWALRSIPHLVHFLSNPLFIKWGANRPKLFEPKSLSRILTALLLLSEERKGAALYVIDQAELSSRLVSTTTHELNWKVDIERLTFGELVTYLSRDGAFVVDRNGRIFGAGVYFNVPGGRKKSAEHIALNRGGHALVVSQDGALYFYSQLLKRMYGTPRPTIADKDSFARLDFLPIDEEPFRLSRAEALGLSSAMPVTVGQTEAPVVAGPVVQKRSLKVRRSGFRRRSRK